MTEITYVYPDSKDGKDGIEKKLKKKLDKGAKGSLALLEESWKKIYRERTLFMELPLNPLCPPVYSKSMVGGGVIKFLFLRSMQCNAVLNTQPLQPTLVPSFHIAH